ncbi:TRAP transporter substrate-binding protein [Celeribacter litoreus]|uniref:TRAP transporter substrate-binding protein n=1 Tax=Celeribacter litoreus TaxID=2876714 RepID=UPI001CC98422|nr:TRAP transporter substrate-binding protein [Celeribacter litoreus]MCA0042512.1 TRAP transporter substrate-binding protein [Celeribacter litoreus]
MKHLLKSTALAAALTVGTFAAHAETWDVSIPWGPSEFHTIDAQNFAAAVLEATDGELELIIHPAGALGVRPNETVRALEDGVVPMGETAAFLNVGDVPLLGLDGLPFLIQSEEDLDRFFALIRPVWAEALEERNQKLLYAVPWPTQLIYTKKEVNTLDDLKGVPIRTLDAITTTMADSLGMLPLILGSGDIVPALATGKLESVMTSGTTAVAQKYWEFMDYGYVTDHIISLNIMSVNMDYWNDLDPETQKTVEDLALKMEPEFWEVAAAEHETRIAELEANGMTIEEPSEELLATMRAATADMEGALIERAGPKAAEVLEAFHAGE